MDLEIQLQGKSRKLNIPQDQEGKIIQIFTKKKWLKTSCEGYGVLSSETFSNFLIVVDFVQTVPTFIEKWT